jgi:hypothetical protein
MDTLSLNGGLILLKVGFYGFPFGLCITKLISVKV